MNVVFDPSQVNTVAIGQYHRPAEGKAQCSLHDPTPNLPLQLPICPQTGKVAASTNAS
jgi:hypothetical protein